MCSGRNICNVKRIKDSLKSYLNSGTGSAKSKLILMAEDIGYHLDRTGSTYLDTTFAMNYAGIFIYGRQTGTGTIGTERLLQ